VATNTAARQKNASSLRANIIDFNLTDLILHPATLDSIGGRAYLFKCAKTIPSGFG
jgi:hypothetical protein